MERLLTAVQELSLARGLADVQRIVRTVARELTNCDGATFVLNDKGQFCHYLDEDAIEPLWKGRRFAQEVCISGWVMRHRVPAIIPDIYADPRIPADAYRPTFVKSLAMVPIRTLDPIGAIGNYWASYHAPTVMDVRLLQALADATSVAMENVAVYTELEERVQQRTAELAEAHREIQKRAITDELTGLYNRRGFYEFSAAALRRGTRATLTFVDVDGLKKVNDSLGHAIGDEMLGVIAAALRASFRATDVIARIGGDEFCVLMIEPTLSGGASREVFQRRLDELNANAEHAYHLSASLGFVDAVADGPEDLDRWLIEADRLMYQQKMARKMARSADKQHACPTPMGQAQDDRHSALMY
jgi:diguanylate cyclase (GGDEF)-like protein